MTKTIGDGEYPSLNIMLREASIKKVTFKEKLVIVMYFHSPMNKLDKLRN